jgi:hypothetical protein
MAETTERPCSGEETVGGFENRIAQCRKIAILTTGKGHDFNVALRSQVPILTIRADTSH